MSLYDDVRTVWQVEQELIDLSMACKQDGITRTDIEAGDYPEITDRFQALEETYEDFSGLDVDEVSISEYLANMDQYEPFHRRAAIRTTGSIRALTSSKFREANDYWHEHIRNEDGFPDV